MQHSIHLLLLNGLLFHPSSPTVLANLWKATGLVVACWLPLLFNKTRMEARGEKEVNKATVDQKIK